MKFRFIFIAYIIIGFSISCSHEEEQIIDEETYLNIFTELIILNQYDDQLLVDQTRDELQQKIYRQYATTEELFLKSHEFYQKDVEKQLERLQIVAQKLRDEREIINEKLDEHMGDERNQPRLMN